MIALSGVRSSWLMRAMNSDFALLASASCASLKRRFSLMRRILALARRIIAMTAITVSAPTMKASV